MNIEASSIQFKFFKKCWLKEFLFFLTLAALFRIIFKTLFESIIIIERVNFFNSLQGWIINSIWILTSPLLFFLFHDIFFAAYFSTYLFYLPLLIRLVFFSSVSKLLMAKTLNSKYPKILEFALLLLKSTEQFKETWLDVLRLHCITDTLKNQRVVSRGDKCYLIK